MSLSGVRPDFWIVSSINSRPWDNIFGRYNQGIRDPLRSTDSHILRFTGYRSNWVFSNIISRTKFPGVPSFRVKRDVPEFTLRVSNFIGFSFKLMSVSGGTPLAPGKKENTSIPRLVKRAPKKCHFLRDLRLWRRRSAEPQNEQRFICVHLLANN